MSTGKIIGIGIAALVGVVVFGWAFGWFVTPLEITSAENVRKQWAFAYQYDESLKAAAMQVCSMERAVKEAQVSEERMQRQSQLLAFQQNYVRIEAEYNAKLRNAFEAKMVKPADVPNKAPSLDTLKREVCGS